MTSSRNFRRPLLLMAGLVGAAMFGNLARAHAEIDRETPESKADENKSETTPSPATTAPAPVTPAAPVVVPPAQPSRADLLRARAEAEELARLSNANPPKPPATESTGFMIGAGFGFGPALGFSEDGVAGRLGIRGGVEIGYKWSRVNATLALDMTAVDAIGSGAGQSARLSGFLLLPGLQIALWRSSDLRLEVLGGARIGLGTALISPGTSASLPMFVSYEIAPGVRYFLHRHFAIQGTAGYAGFYQISKSGTSSSTVGVHGASATLSLLAVL